MRELDRICTSGRALLLPKVAQSSHDHWAALSPEQRRERTSAAREARRKS